MSPRIPTPEDFSSLSSALKLTLHPPSPPESTIAFLILLHGLGDTEVPFAAFARAISLPGVYSIAVRGVAPIPPALLGSDSPGFHWGDDLALASAGGGLDADPGFARAADLLLGRLLRDTLVAKLGWEERDVLVFGFGQGGALALGLAARLAVEAGDDNATGLRSLKGIVSVGGALPASMTSTISSRAKSATPVLLCRGRASETLDDDAVGYVRREFSDVEVVEWRKADDSMPRNRDEMLPVMKFFAARLRHGW
jgi:predicted esterase